MSGILDHSPPKWRNHHVNRLRTIGAFGALLIVLAACNGPAASGGSTGAVERGTCCL